MNRYLRFEMVEKKPKTEVYVVSFHLTTFSFLSLLIFNTI